MNDQVPAGGAEPAGTTEAPSTAAVETPPREPGLSRGTVVAFMLGALALVFVVLWLDVRAQFVQFAGLTRLQWQGQLEQEHPLHEFAYEGDRSVRRWRETGRLAIVDHDRDADGIPEAREWHARDGELVRRSIDADEDGVFERVETVGPDGRVTRLAVDADQDGRFEQIEERPGHGPRVRWLDTDGDGFCERLEVRQGDGLVLVQRFRGDAGCETLR